LNSDCHSTQGVQVESCLSKICVGLHIVILIKNFVNLNLMMLSKDTLQLILI